MNRKQYSLEYPLKVIEINDFKRNPFYILEQCGLNYQEIAKLNQMQTNVLMFIDSYDYKKYFSEMQINFLMLNRLINVDSYENANKLYKLFLNSKIWLIHGFIQNNEISLYKSDNEEANFLLILNTTDLYVKNQILDGLKRLLDSFLTNKKFLFEISFDEILKTCFKRKMEIQYLHRITTSKFKCIKSNILFTTLNLNSSEANFIVERQNNNNDTKFGLFMKRFRNAFSYKIQNMNSNVITSKFSLNQLPYLSYQYGSRNTFTFSVNNEDKFLKMYKNSHILYQQYYCTKNSLDKGKVSMSKPMDQNNSHPPDIPKACSKTSLLPDREYHSCTPANNDNQVYINDIQNYYYNDFDKLNLEVEENKQNSESPSHVYYYNVQNELEINQNTADLYQTPQSSIDHLNSQKSFDQTVASSASSSSSTISLNTMNNKIPLQKAKSADQLISKEARINNKDANSSYFEDIFEEHIYEDENLILSEEDNNDLAIKSNTLKQSASQSAVKNLQKTSFDNNTYQATTKSQSSGSIRYLSKKPTVKQINKSTCEAIFKQSAIQTGSNNNMNLIKRQSKYIKENRPVQIIHAYIPAASFDSLSTKPSIKLLKRTSYKYACHNLYPVKDY